VVGGNVWLFEKGKERMRWNSKKQVLQGSYRIMTDELQIISFREEFLNEAAALFIANYRRQRQAIALLLERSEPFLDEIFRAGVYLCNAHLRILSENLEIDKAI
jgi:hypothetical protein